MYKYWKRYFDLTPEEVEKRQEKFIEDSGRYGSILFCINCGSTNIDQNAINELRCYNCNQTLSWNGFRFSVARKNVGASDVVLALEAPLTSSYDGWHREVEERLGQYLSEIVIDALDSDDFSSERLARLNSEWQNCKKAVDILFQDRLSS